MDYLATSNGMNTLTEAYKIIFGKKPENLESWEIARAIMNKFDVPKLGEQLAREVLTEIITNVGFPNSEITHEIVGHAENLLTEFTDEFGDEPHFAAVEAGENQKKYRK